MRADSEIKQAVQAALGLDPRVAAFSPDVNVESGIVILGGTVGNLKAKASAEPEVTSSVLAKTDAYALIPSSRPTDAEEQRATNFSHNGYKNGYSDKKEGQPVRAGLLVSA